MFRSAIPIVISVLLLAGCADDHYYDRYDRQPPPPPPSHWIVTHHGGETDYEMLDEVLFATDSADLSPHAHDAIAEMAEALRHHRQAPIEVDGYTDTVGTREYNAGLSQARAQSVADALVREGVNPRRITTHGFGETHLAVPTPDNVHERRNRRVVIRVLPERRNYSY